MHSIALNANSVWDEPQMFCMVRVLQMEFFMFFVTPHPSLQASRLREEAHTMGSIYMSENCTELKNLRSLVRVCEIQATLREQR